MRQPEIVFFTGTMKSGKSEQLIKNIDKAVDMAVPYLVLKPSQDTRDGSKVRSRALKYDYDAIAVNMGNFQLCKLILQGIEHYATVFIDEVQFVDPMFLKQIADRCYTYGVDLVVSGLTYDYMGNPFDSAVYLHEYADQVVELNSECDGCGSQADRDILVRDGKIVTEGDSVAVEGSVNEFMTICNKCVRDLFFVPNGGLFID
jgi:thymidine kinase